MKKQTLRDRFDAKWIPEPNTGCWLWMASTNVDGYGFFSARGEGILTRWAHRHAWMLYRGPIPAGMVIDHVCRVRSCVNPDHLRVVTPHQNIVENSASPIALNFTKTCCSRCGGEYTTTKKQRICLVCKRRESREYYYRTVEQRRCLRRQRIAAVPQVGRTRILGAPDIPMPAMPHDAGTEPCHLDPLPIVRATHDLDQ